MATFLRMLAGQTARHRCFPYAELADALPKTPKEKIQKRRSRTRRVEGVWYREAAGDRLTR